VRVRESENDQVRHNHSLVFVPSYD
jgi:hypothetical protein